ncbi:MAG: ROK family protein, partial [Hylemonella sp.]|nr:ROK family protein [Hylemonella sp.]
CGPFVLKDGQIELATPNICGGLAELPGGPPNDWRSVPLEALLRPHWPALRIENDAVAALEAERRWGALQGLDHCAYLTWSTGVGVGLCVDGHVLRGKQGNAGHAGHSFVGDDAVDAWCGCGNRGDVEALVSGHAMAQRYGRPARALLEAAEAGDGAALLAVEQVCHTLGRLLYNLVVTLDLQRISLGGSVFVHHADLLLPRLDAQVRSRLPALTAGVELVAAGLGPEVGDYAALALVS